MSRVKKKLGKRTSATVIMKLVGCLRIVPSDGVAGCTAGGGAGIKGKQYLGAGGLHCPQRASKKHCLDACCVPNTAVSSEDIHKDKRLGFGDSAAHDVLKQSFNRVAVLHGIIF